jgi:hypothetical protein
VIVPSAELPFATPFTSQAIVPAAKPAIVPLPFPQNVTVKVWLCARASATAPGEMEFTLPQIIVMLALADFVESAMLVAVIVTFAGEGSESGAV